MKVYTDAEIRAMPMEEWSKGFIPLGDVCTHYVDKLKVKRELKKIETLQLASEESTKEELQFVQNAKKKINKTMSAIKTELKL